MHDGSSTDVFALRIRSLRRAIGYDAPLSIVDVGANPRHHDAPYKELYENGDVLVTGFDPQAATLEELQRAGRPGDQYLPYAIGDGRAHQLTLYRGSGLTSVLRIRRKTLFFLKGLRRAAREIGSETIETKRLDDLPQVSKMDLLKIDIQGAEPMVFDNGQTALEKAVAVHTEVNFFPLYDHQQGFGTVDEILRKAGFVPHSFYSTVKRHVLSRFLREVPGLDRTQILDGDMIYFRDLSDPDKLEDAQICKLALVADGIYGFYDYVLRCIEILEQRGVTDPLAVREYLAQLKRLSSEKA